MDQQPAQQPPAAAPEPVQPSAAASTEPPPAQPPQASAWATPTEPTGPAPGLQYGGYGGRLVAYIIDGILAFVIAMAASLVLGVIGVLLASMGMDFFAGISFVAIFALIFVISLGYFPWFWWRSGQTPGMRLFGLRVVRDRDGGPISGGQAVLRLIGYWINSFVFYIGFIWIFVDSRRRGWHDLIAGTIVVQEDR